jgi:hypothetical protein
MRAFADAPGRQAIGEPPGQVRDVAVAQDVLIVKEVEEWAIRVLSCAVVEQLHRVAGKRCGFYISHPSF